MFALALSASVAAFFLIILMLRFSPTSCDKANNKEDNGNFREGHASSIPPNCPGGNGGQLAFILKSYTMGNMSMENPKNSDPKPPKKSLFEMTAEDHQAIGSTPPAVLIENPGKRLLDVVSDQEILDHLRGEADGMAKLEKLGSTQVENYKNRLRETLRFLKLVGRLPKEFENYEVP